VHDVDEMKVKTKQQTNKSKLKNKENRNLSGLPPHGKLNLDKK